MHPFLEKAFEALIEAEEVVVCAFIGIAIAVAVSTTADDYPIVKLLYYPWIFVSFPVYKKAQTKQKRIFVLNSIIFTIQMICFCTRLWMIVYFCCSSLSLFLSSSSNNCIFFYISMIWISLIVIFILFWSTIPPIESSILESDDNVVYPEVLTLPMLLIF